MKDEQEMQLSEMFIFRTVRLAIEDALIRADVYDPKLVSSKNRAKLHDLLSQYQTVAPLLARRVVTRENLAKWVAERLGEEQEPDISPNIGKA